MTPIDHYFLGFDLGIERDHSALSLLGSRQIEDGPFDAARFGQPMRPVLELQSLIRIPLRTEYLEVMRRFREIVTKLIASAPWGYKPPPIYVVIDAAGPGQIAIELIRQQHLDIWLIPTQLTAAADSHHLPNGKITIPRRELIANTRYLLESDTMRIAAGLKYGPVLEQELAAIRPHGGQTEHDDLAIATGLAAWHATRLLPQLLRQRRAS